MFMLMALQKKTEYNQSIQYAQQAAPDCRFAAAADAGRYEASKI